MVVLDATIVNIALPSAQQDLGISDGDRQWVITAYALAFGSLLLLGGRIADLWRPQADLPHRPDRLRRRLRARRRGVNGSAMLLGARALQGAFGALLAPAALSLLAVTFTEPASGPRRSASTAPSPAAAARRADPRRRADRVPGLALVPLRQRPHRRRRRSSVRLLRPPRARRQPRPRCLDIPGVVLVAARPGRAGVRLHPRRVRRLGLGAVTSACSSPASSCSPRSSLVESRVRTRCCRCAWCSTATAAARTCRSASPSSAMFGLFLFLTYYLQLVKGYSPVADRLRLPADDRAVHDHRPTQHRRPPDDPRAAARPDRARACSSPPPVWPADPARRTDARTRRACCPRELLPASAWGW